MHLIIVSRETNITILKGASNNDVGEYRINVSRETSETIKINIVSRET